MGISPELSFFPVKISIPTVPPVNVARVIAKFFWLELGEILGQDRGLYAERGVFDLIKSTFVIFFEHSD